MSEQSRTLLSKNPILVRIESFGPQHDRTTFSCGNTYIDAKLHRAVLPLHSLNLTRAFVAVEPGKTEVLGFYSMNAHTIEVYDAPQKWQQLIEDNGIGGIPAAYISLFATRERVQGHGIGRAMMADALRRIKKTSDISMGIFAVVLDAIDQPAFDFYYKIGFRSLDSNHSLRMFYLVSNIP